MKPSILAATIVVATLVALPGCSSTYTPRPGPRLSMVMSGGKMAYVRDGQKWDFGFLGSGLVSAVRGNPRAESTARRYREKTIRGFVFTVLGSACTTGTLMYMFVRSLEEEDYQPSRMLAVTSLGCAIGMIWGSVDLAGAQPLHWDAINIYNDDVEARGVGPYAPGFTPGGPFAPPPGTAPLPWAPPPSR